MGKYSVQINEDNLDLIQQLNGGVRPAIEERTTVFVFDTDESKSFQSGIFFEDDMYDENGSSLDGDIHWLIG
jgi:hypothetical protein